MTKFIARFWSWWLFSVLWLKFTNDVWCEWRSMMKFMDTVRSKWTYAEVMMYIQKLLTRMSFRITPSLWSWHEALLVCATHLYRFSFSLEGFITFKTDTTLTSARHKSLSLNYTETDNELCIYQRDCFSNKYVESSIKMLQKFKIFIPNFKLVLYEKVYQFKVVQKNVQ